MENSKMQNEILENVKGLPDGTADQVLDFIFKATTKGKNRYIR